MFSSFNPWEFKQNFPHLLNENTFGLYAFHCYDPYLEKIYFNSIPNHFVDSGFKTISGSEVTKSWLEDNLATLDFFSANQSYKVLMAEQMPADAKEFLINGNIDWDRRYFLLSFTKDDKFFDQCKKQKDVTSLKVVEPKFWEGGKLLKFLCEVTGVYLPMDVQNYMLNSVVNEPGELILAIKKLTLLGGDTKKLNIQIAKELLSVNKIDQFEMARAWGDKKFTNFYKDLLVQSEDYDGMMHFFRFMQGHIIKMIDPSYMDGKSKLSKYDKQIEGQSRMWTKADLKDEMRFFGECEVMAKSKSRDLTQALRLKVINSY